MFLLGTYCSVSSQVTNFTEGQYCPSFNTHLLSNDYEPGSVQEMEITGKLNTFKVTRVKKRDKGHSQPPD